MNPLIIEYSNDLFSKRKPEVDPNFAERTPLEGNFKIGDFVSFKDSGQKRYGFLRSMKKKDKKPDLIEFTSSKGVPEDYADFTNQFTDIQRVMVPLNNLEVTVCDLETKEKVKGQFLIGRKLNLLFVSNEQNALMDDLRYKKFKYSAEVLSAEEYDRMNNEACGRISNALIIIEQKNKGFRFTETQPSVRR